MKTLIRLLLFSLLASPLLLGQAPAGVPAGSTGMCNDGTYTTAASKRGACSGHKGVKDWYGTAATSSSKPSSASSTSNPALPGTSKSAKTEASSNAPASGGGAGKVWLNTASNVYHCPGDRWYGKTKSGAYMTEAEAKAKGAHPDHGKACQ